MFFVAEYRLKLPNVMVTPKPSCLSGECHEDPNIDTYSLTSCYDTWYSSLRPNSVHSCAFVRRLLNEAKRGAAIILLPTSKPYTTQDNKQWTFSQCHWLRVESRLERSECAMDGYVAVGSI